MLTWSDKFATNILVIDTQHQQVFELLKNLGNAFKQGNYNQEILNDALNQLNAYSVNHFKMESKLMAENSIDSRHIKLHSMEHKSFIYDTQQLWQNTISEENAMNISEQLISFITSWWSYHILGMDQILAEQFFAIRRGMSPEEAYETYKTIPHDAATTKLMLDSVLDLWHVTTKRCHALEEKLLRLRKPNEL